jgi:hypothetical protein
MGCLQLLDLFAYTVSMKPRSLGKNNTKKKHILSVKKINNNENLLK